MSERNDRMAAMLAADAPAARDALFEIAVLGRIERRAFHRALAQRVVMAAIAASLLGLIMPPLLPLWQQGLEAGAQMIPHGGTANLVIGLLLMAASAALPFWRRAR